MTERFAIYYAPAVESPLWRRAAQWLGRDAADGAPAHADIAGIAPAQRQAITRSARRYGFHATLKAPMRLAAGRTAGQLVEALEAFARDSPPVEIGRLRLALLGGFLALVPELQSAKLSDFAATCVTAFEPFRAPLSPAERDRRIRGGKLGARQVALLERHGYPYVMEDFMFHMTLTDRLDPALQDAVMAAASAWFGHLLAEPIMLDRLALFRQEEPDGDFRRDADFHLAVTEAA
jgi:putative phosphonate metabolism protein